MDVRNREPQEPEPCVDEQVLPAVVLDQAVPVVSTVVLDDESRPGIVEIGSADKSLLTVTKIGLHLWTR